VTAGSIADLFLLEDNPLVDINNVRRITGVVLRAAAEPRSLSQAHLNRVDMASGLYGVLLGIVMVVLTTLAPQPAGAIIFWSLICIQLSWCAVICWRRTDLPFASAAMINGSVMSAGLVVLALMGQRAEPNGRGSDSSRRMRTREQQIAGDLERSDSLRAGHGGKMVEKPLEGVAGGQVVEQIPDRDAGAREHRGSTEDLRIGPEH
jgi:hypothetical protein